MQETWVGSLGREDPLEEGTIIPCSTLAWRILWTEELEGRGQGVEGPLHGVSKNLNTTEHAESTVPGVQQTLKNICSNLPGSPVDKTSCFPAGSMGSVPHLGTKIPHAGLPKKIEKFINR